MNSIFSLFGRHYSPVLSENEDVLPVSENSHLVQLEIGKFSEPLHIKQANFNTARYNESVGLRSELRHSETIKESILRATSSQFEEAKIDTTEKCNKIFVSAWLNDEEVLVAGKDNRLHAVNIKSESWREVSVPKRSEVKCFDLNGNVKNFQEPSPDELQKANGCGIHDLESGPNGEMIASTGVFPWDISIYNSQTLDTAMLLTGHTDWIFAIKWLSPNLLISGSRDSNLGFWKLDRDKSSLAKGTLIKMRDSIRALELDNSKSRVFITSSSGIVCSFDLNRRDPVRRFQVPDCEEAVVMSFEESHGLLAIGSRRSISLFDPRMKTPIVRQMDNLQRTWGTRVLKWTGSCLMSAGGLGRIPIYDLRADDYIRMGKKNYFDVTPCWIRDDSQYNDVIEVMGFAPTSIYSLTYNPSETAMLACGGPTQYGLYGSYLGLINF